MSGWRTGFDLGPCRAANAVATGAQPAGWPPTNRTSFGSTSPTSTSSSKPLATFVNSEPEAIGATSDVRQPPAELLGDLERERLAALGVERPEVDVDEGPALLVGDLEAEPVDVVVRAVDADDRRAVAQGVVDLRRLEVRRDEDEGTQPERGRGGGGRPGEVAGRGAGERVEAELDGPGRGDRDDAVLEAQRRVAGVVLEPEAIDAELGSPSRSAETRAVEPTASPRAGAAATGSSSR